MKNRLIWVSILIISIPLGLTAIIDLAQGAQGWSLWAAAICWPLAAIAAAIGLIQGRTRQ